MEEIQDCCCVFRSNQGRQEHLKSACSFTYCLQLAVAFKASNDSRPYPFCSPAGYCNLFGIHSAMYRISRISMYSFFPLELYFHQYAEPKVRLFHDRLHKISNLFELSAGFLRARCAIVELYLVDVAVISAPFSMTWRMSTWPPASCGRPLWRDTAWSACVDHKVIMTIPCKSSAWTHAKLLHGPFVTALFAVTVPSVAAMAVACEVHSRGRGFRLAREH